VSDLSAWNLKPNFRDVAVSEDDFDDGGNIVYDKIERKHSIGGLVFLPLQQSGIVVKVRKKNGSLDAFLFVIKRERRRYPSGSCGSR
jgi:hypothetical protein